MTIKELKQHEKIIKTFETKLGKNLKLTKIQAPLFVSKDSLLNDSLNGFERPVSFDCKLSKQWEVVQSLAKWKRVALEKYKFPIYEGLYTHMKAIRRDEDLDATHSYFVEQWDWEKVILKKDRKIGFLKTEVKKIYQAILETTRIFSKIELPDEIVFITAEELEKAYPKLLPKERENKIAQKHKAVFIIGIGWELSSGIAHDGRAPDYDDWKLNGDILVWFEPLGEALELSSMGIRVCEESLVSQLKHRKQEKLATSKFHSGIIEKKWPYTIGGGIGQSRILMFILSSPDLADVQLFTSL